MTTYPLANTTTAWYADNYPGSHLELSDKTAVVVLHTTEGTSLPSYSGGATAPTMTAVPDFGARRLKWYQHFPDEMSGRALRNLVGGVETNTLNAMQWELVGTCDPRAHAQWSGRHIYWPEAPEWALRDLARALAHYHRTKGLRLDGPPSPLRAYPDSYGAGPQRMSFTQWRGFTGVCGHQSVPENLHGDPGNLDLARVLELARGMVERKAPRGEDGELVETPDEVLETPRWDALYEQAARLRRQLPDGATHRRADLQAIMDTAAKWSRGH